MLLVLSCAPHAVELPAPEPVVTTWLEAHERLVVVLGTNDVHGAVEASTWVRDGEEQAVGGLEQLSGVVASVRAGLAAKHGDRAGVVLVDGGDQFQGTLLSNFDQGALVYGLFDAIGYDAVVPGNHGHDFAPGTSMDPASGDVRTTGEGPPVLRALGEGVSFPLLGANVWLRDGTECPEEVHPSWIAPYAVTAAAGLRVGIVGVEHPETPLMTNAANVADWCFSDPVTAVERVLDEVEDRADLWIVVGHLGDGRGSSDLSELTSALSDRIDGVVGGHTHFVNRIWEAGVPAVQSGSSALQVGRIELVYDTRTGAVDRLKSRSYAGIPLWHQACDSRAPFCTRTLDGVAWDGVSVVPAPDVVAQVASAREALAPLSSLVLGQSPDRIERHRIDESALANALTDALLEAVPAADLALLNSGGMRAPIERGALRYGDFFEVLPFDNEVVVLDCPASAVRDLLLRSADQCGRHGALFPAGARVRFTRRGCEGGEQPTVLHDARLADGRDLLTTEDRLSVATVDFLAGGGSGYTEFALCDEVARLGNQRQLLVHRFLEHPFDGGPGIDGRWSAE